MILVGTTTGQVLFNYAFPEDTSSGTLTLSTPEGTVTGDLAVVAVQGQMKYSSPNVSASDGWSSGKTTGGAAGIEKTFYQVLTGSGPWDITLTGLYASALQAIMIVIRGAGAIAYGSDLVTSTPTQIKSPALLADTPEVDAIVEAFAGLGTTVSGVSDGRLTEAATLSQVTQHRDISDPSGYHNETQLLQMRYWLDVPSGTTIGQNIITTDGTVPPGVLRGVTGFTMRYPASAPLGPPAALLAALSSFAWIID